VSILVTDLRIFSRRRRRGGRKVISFSNAMVDVVRKQPRIVFIIRHCTVENFGLLWIVGDLTSSGRCQIIAAYSIRGAVTEVKSRRNYCNGAPHLALAILPIASPN
jgi:hypothetical protein